MQKVSVCCLKSVSVCNHKQKLPHTYGVSSFLSDCILVGAKLNIILGIKERDQKKFNV